MARLLKPRSKKVGLPPGTLVHIGDQGRTGAGLEVIEYDADHLTRRLIGHEEACLVRPGLPTVSWLNLEGLGDVALLQKIGDCFGIHPLVLEDVANTDQRPKAEEYDNYIYLVMKMLSPQENGRMTVEQVSFVLGESWLLSFQEGLDGDLFAPVRTRLDNETGRFRKNGPDYLAYALMDVIVDNYFVVLERLADRIELIEEELVATPSQSTLQAIYQLKRELLFLHKAIWPLREVVSSLIRRESALVRESTLIYLRDLYDHTVQVIETVETLREMLGGMLDIYLSSVSNRMNAIMKVLTIIATIFMPLTFLAGIYGMNFKYMPELEWHWGYPVLLLVMVVITIVMLRFFRRKEWL